MYSSQAQIPSSSQEYHNSPFCRGIKLLEQGCVQDVLQVGKFQINVKRYLSKSCPFDQASDRLASANYVWLDWSCCMGSGFSGRVQPSFVRSFVRSFVPFLGPLFFRTLENVKPTIHPATELVESQEAILSP